jgi:periplasmic protein TonB
MKPARNNVKNFSISWSLVVIMLVIIGASGYALTIMLSDDRPRSKSSVTTVTLLKPPPPQIKEKMPEIEEVKIQQKEEIIEPVPQIDQNSNAASNDDTPAGDNLGLDAEGTAGSDGFGLVGKKGGRSIIAGDGGSGGGPMERLSLLTKYSGYAQIVESEVRKKVMKKLDENGGIPKGKLQTVAKIYLDKYGYIVSYKIVGSSGNHKMDSAVEQSLDTVKLNEPPPDGMPRTITIRISSIG